MIDGTNVYAYVGGNPVNRVDPMGQNQVIIGVGAGAIIGGGWEFGKGLYCGDSWGDIAWNTGKGALIGGATGGYLSVAGVGMTATGVSKAAQGGLLSMWGAAAGALGEMADQVFGRDPGDGMNLTDLALAAGGGAAAGGIAPFAPGVSGGLFSAFEGSGISNLSAFNWCD
jgi:hypothetical protein